MVQTHCSWVGWKATPALSGVTGEREPLNLTCETKQLKGKEVKEATVLVKLSKDNHVQKKHVTPVEVVLLVAEHHRSVGDMPVEVLDTPVEVTRLVEKEVDNPHKPGTKRVDLVRETTKRTIDEELNRLRNIYGRVKVKTLLSEVRDIPTEDFKKAMEIGMNVTLPSSELSQTKLI